MTLPTKILLASLMIAGMNVYADLTATDEGSSKFEAAKTASTAPAAETSAEVLKPDQNDDALEGRVCTTECSSANTHSVSLLKHNNFSDLRKVGQISAKEP